MHAYCEEFVQKLQSEFSYRNFHKDCMLGGEVLLDHTGF